MIATRFLNLLTLTGLALASVELDSALIPAVPAELPVYSLGSPSYLPDDWLAGVVGTGSRERNYTDTPYKRHDGHGDPRSFFYDSDQVVGYVNKDTGETRVYPNYGSLQPYTDPVDIHYALSHIQQGSRAFPSDDTCTEVVEGSSLRGSDNSDVPVTEGSGTVSKRSNDTDSGDSTYLTLGVVHRYVDYNGHKYPVCGPGSRAIFGVGYGNRVYSVSYYWKPAKKCGKTCRSSSIDEVVRRIKEWLKQKYCKDGRSIRVQTVDVCFYDSGAQYLQPVYRVLSNNAVTNGTTATEVFLDYVPIGSDAVEPIDPQRTHYGDGQGSPLQPQQPTEHDAGKAASRSILNYFNARQSQGIKVGMYVVRNDSPFFVGDAVDFWGALSSNPIFTLTQFFWSLPILFKDWAHFYINAVDVALVGARGQWHGFSTDDGKLRPDPSFVRIPEDLPPDGYGKRSNGGKGRLSYWIIDAGEVMPTTPDFSACKVPDRTYPPWKPVFKGGIHAILSWRTALFLTDDASSCWAEEVARFNRPVVDAWFFCSHMSNFYNLRYRVNCPAKPWLPFSRAAAMFRCDRPRDRVTNLEKLDEPQCLSAWWWSD